MMLNVFPSLEQELLIVRFYPGKGSEPKYLQDRQGRAASRPEERRRVAPPGVGRQGRAGPDPGPPERHGDDGGEKRRRARHGVRHHAGVPGMRSFPMIGAAVRGVVLVHVGGLAGGLRAEQVDLVGGAV
jgi:hypothetical protein